MESTPHIAKNVKLASTVVLGSKAAVSLENTAQLATLVSSALQGSTEPAIQWKHASHVRLANIARAQQWHAKQQSVCLEVHQGKEQLEFRTALTVQLADGALVAQRLKGAPCAPQVSTVRRVPQVAASASTEKLPLRGHKYAPSSAQRPVYQTVCAMGRPVSALMGGQGPHAMTNLPGRPPSKSSGRFFLLHPFLAFYSSSVSASERVPENMDTLWLST
jgi:hypothetical protein